MEVRDATAAAAATADESVAELQILLEQKQLPPAQNRDSGRYSEARAASPPPLPPQYSQNQDLGRYSEALAASPPPLPQHSQDQDSGRYSEARATSLPPPMLLPPSEPLYSEVLEHRPPGVGRGRGRGCG